MQFNSIPFLFFFAFVYFVYWNIPRKIRIEFLLLSSVFFYGYYSIPLLLHFILVIAINYYFYRLVNRSGSKAAITASVVLNLLNLGFFKYFYFFMRMLGDISGVEVFYQAPQLISITMPLAISFYSFQMIAASVDVYRKPVETPITIKNYFAFVLFFPVLMAGPIMRTNDFLPNLARKGPQKDQIYRACFLMMSGLVKKILIADPVALMILPVYNNPGEYSGFTLFMAGILYTLQVYSDFSGLTDMARSVALFLGFEIPENFYAPFFSLNMRELWRRWHVTFSFWIRDYIYFPLGGSRVAEWRIYFNLLITMTLGGFWHGANYTFLAWGAYMGVILMLERLLEEKLGLALTPRKNPLLKVLKAFFVFILFSISALMFRSNDWQSLVELFRGIFTNHSSFLQEKIIAKGGGWLVDAMDLVSAQPSFQMNTIKNYESIAYMYVMFLVFHYFQYKPESLQRFQKYNFALVVILGVLTIFLITSMASGGAGFIYNKF